MTNLHMRESESEQEQLTQPVTLCILAIFTYNKTLKASTVSKVRGDYHAVSEDFLQREEIRFQASRRILCMWYKLPYNK